MHWHCDLCRVATCRYRYICLLDHIGIVLIKSQTDLDMNNISIRESAEPSRLGFICELITTYNLNANSIALGRLDTHRRLNKRCSHCGMLLLAKDEALDTLKKGCVFISFGLAGLNLMCQ